MNSREFDESVIAAGDGYSRGNETRSSGRLLHRCGAGQSYSLPTDLYPEVTQIAVQMKAKMTWGDLPRSVARLNGSRPLRCLHGLRGRTCRIERPVPLRAGERRPIRSRKRL